MTSLTTEEIWFSNKVCLYATIGNEGLIRNSIHSPLRSPGFKFFPFWSEMGKNRPLARFAEPKLWCYTKNAILNGRFRFLQNSQSQNVQQTSGFLITLPNSVPAFLEFRGFFELHVIWISNVSQSSIFCSASSSYTVGHAILL